MSQEQPIYPIGAVERLTGIVAATLRAWERRYGFPVPARTQGGHRLYSKAHVQALIWIKAQIDRGVQARQAVQMGMQAEGLAPKSAAPAHPFLLSDQAQLAAALSAGDIQGADRAFEALSHLPPEHLIVDVILPALREIGEAWAEGRMTISGEHVASQYLRDRMSAWLHTGPPAYHVQPVALACAPGELHEGSLLAFGTLLRRRRWPVRYLGQSVPLEDLATYVEIVRPLALVLVAMREQTAQALAHWPKALPQVARSGHPPVTFGGRVFVVQPTWQNKIQGLYLGDDLPQGIESLERLLRPSVSPAILFDEGSAG
jgi:DNA-binding transcriptional MerR regulator